MPKSQIKKKKKRCLTLNASLVGRWCHVFQVGLYLHMHLRMTLKGSFCIISRSEVCTTTLSLTDAGDRTHDFMCARRVPSILWWVPILFIFSRETIVIKADTLAFCLESHWFLHAYKAQ